MKNQNSTKHADLDLSNVDHVSSYVRPSQFGAMLYVLEDNEAMIKIIIKERSPTMRHVSRTHRVALDWLNDGMCLDPKIQTRYIDTKHQFADILTKGNFTHDEWNHLLHLFNISHFSSLCCAQNFSLTSCPKTMAKSGDELDINCFDKVLIREPSDCVGKLWDTECICREEIQNPTQRRVLKEG